MIQMQTILQVADNSGAKTVMCIKVLGGSHRMIAGIGDVIVVSVKTASPGAKLKKGEVYKAVIVRSKYGVRRDNGTSLKFGSNAVVLLNKQNEPLGTRIFGVVTRELRAKNFLKIVSLAKEVI